MTSNSPYGTYPNQSVFQRVRESVRENFREFPILVFAVCIALPAALLVSVVKIIRRKTNG